MSALTTHTYSNLRQKEKEKKWIKETPKSDRKRKKGKEKDHLKKTSLGPLRQRQRLDTFETKLCSSKERKPPNQNRKPQRAPLHTCKLPLNQWKSPWTNACKPPPKQSSCFSFALTIRPVHLTDQTNGQDRLARGNNTGQTCVPHKSSRCHLGNCPSSKIARNYLKTF
jgi:hypothetical protein